MSAATKLENRFTLNQMIPDLESRLNENKSRINELGLKIVYSRTFTISSARKQTVAKYICTYKNWQITIKDKAHIDQPDGVLGIYEIECMNTGEVYYTNCNIKGSDIDKKRFIFLKGVMDNGIEAHLASLSNMLEELEDRFFSENLSVSSNIKPDIQTPEGEMVIEKGDYQLSLRVTENTEGVQAISISNSKSWSNAHQNRTHVKGEFFPLQGFCLEEVNSYVLNFFNELETGTLNSAIPVHLFKQGYSWITN